MLECAENLVGIRAECSATPPLSGVYIEDLAGLNFKKITDTADAGKAVDLIKTALSEAENIVSNQILYYIPENGAVYSKGIGQKEKRAFWHGWQSGVEIVGETTEKFEVKLKQPNQWQFSCVELGELMVYPDTDIVDFTITITDVDPLSYPNERIRTFNLGFVRGNFKNYIQILDAENKQVTCFGSFKIETNDLSDITSKRVLYNKLNCGTCGNKSETENNYFVFSGNRNFFVELYSTCKKNDLLCYLYTNEKYASQLGRAIRYQAGVYLLMEAKNSDRDNFFIQNLDAVRISELEGNYRYDYEQIKELYFPIMIGEILQAEKMCFVCRGWVASQATY